jgi:hypothetical protein
MADLRQLHAQTLMDLWHSRFDNSITASTHLWLLYNHTSVTITSTMLWVSCQWIRIRIGRKMEPQHSDIKHSDAFRHQIWFRCIQMHSDIKRGFWQGRWSPRMPQLFLNITKGRLNWHSGHEKMTRSRITELTRYKYFLCLLQSAHVGYLSPAKYLWNIIQKFVLHK